jgi:large subunit ribosomal protein L16
MAMMPSKVKYRRMQRGSRKGFASRAIKIDFGSFGLQSLGRAWVTGPQIEAARVALTRHMKRKGKVWIRIFPHKSVSKKPAEVRMGQGKGAPEVWVAVVKPGTVMFEVDGIPESTAKECLALAAAKLPIRSRFLSKRFVV